MIYIILLLALQIIPIQSNNNFLYYTKTHMDFIKCNRAGNVSCLPIIDGKLGNGVCCKS